MSLHAENPNYPLTIRTQISLRAADTGITSRFILNSSFPNTGWDFRIALNQSEPELPEIFIRYNSKNFFTQMGSMYISGLQHYLENPFSVNSYKDFFSSVSVSLASVPITTKNAGKKYPEVLIGWKKEEHLLAVPVALYAYAVPPGFNESALYKAGFIGYSFLQQQSIQVGALMHGLQSGDNLLEDSEWYPEEMQARSDSREGVSAGVALHQENSFAESGIIGLVSLDPFLQSGFMAGGALSLNRGLLSIKYFQTIYSPAYPIVYPENSNGRLALQAGSVILELPKLLRISVKMSEEIYSIDWSFRDEIEADRSCITDAEIELGIVVIKLKDSLIYSYPVNGQELSVYRTLNADCSLNFGVLKIAMDFTAAHANRRFKESGKSVALKIKTGKLYCSFKIDFSGTVQKSRIELKISGDHFKISVNADTSMKYQVSVTAKI